MKTGQHMVERVGNAGIYSLGKEILPLGKGIAADGMVESNPSKRYQYVFNKRYVDEKEVMEALNVTRETLRRCLQEVNISVMVLKNRRLILREDLEWFLEKHINKTLM